MEKCKMEVARKLFNLTLEIIYLLTGEDFMVVRECGEMISWKVHHVSEGSKAILPSKSDKNILEVTSRIIHLLTGEVQQFVGRTEYSQPSPTRDGCDNIKESLRYPHPLYSQDSTEQDPHDDHEENAIRIKVEDEEDPCMRDDKFCDEDETPPEISTDGSSNRSSPERCPGSLDSSDSTDHTIPPNDQTENLLEGMKVLFVPHTEHTHEDTEGMQTDVIMDDAEKNCFSLPEILGYECVCYDCGKVGISSTSHQQEDAHIRLPLCCDCDKASPLKPFFCTKCGKSFSSKMLYMAHQSIHTGGQSFPCGECGLTFSNKSILETHQSIHTGDRPFSCLECGKCFAMKANLVKHLKIHKGEKPFSCPQCGKHFSIKSNLVKHQRVHTGEKPFECVYCGRTFSTKSNLVKHQRIHTGEKPFKCMECGKCFASRSNLTTHEKIHTGEKPFSCSICCKGFITSSDLMRHQKTHTGERPFICSDCGKSFINKSVLRAHQKSHTGDHPALDSLLVPDNVDSC